MAAFGFVMAVVVCDFESCDGGVICVVCCVGSDVCVLFVRRESVVLLLWFGSVLVVKIPPGTVYAALVL